MFFILLFFNVLWFAYFALILQFLKHLVNLDLKGAVEIKFIIVLISPGISEL